MSQTIDIKTKKIIPQQTGKFEKTLVLENLERNILSNWETWGKFQQAWTNRAYRVFKDLDKPRYPIHPELKDLKDGDELLVFKAKRDDED